METSEVVRLSNLALAEFIDHIGHCFRCSMERPKKGPIVLKMCRRGKPLYEAWVQSDRGARR